MLSIGTKDVIVFLFLSFLGYKHMETEVKIWDVKKNVIWNLVIFVKSHIDLMIVHSVFLYPFKVVLRDYYGLIFPIVDQ